VNLLSEACATRTPVAVMQAHSARGRMAQFQRSLCERGRLSASVAQLPERGDTIEPLRETGRIASAVRQHLGL
jgi:mitochondrial fission protein ELM1